MCDATRRIYQPFEDKLTADAVCNRLESGAWNTTLPGGPKN